MQKITLSKYPAACVFTYVLIPIHMPLLGTYIRQAETIDHKRLPSNRPQYVE